MASKNGLETCVDATGVLAKRLEMPVGIINVHRNIKSNTKEAQQLRFGAFLLIYGALEGYFQAICKQPNNTRVTPLVPDKINTKIKNIWNFDTFTRDWSVRTRSAVEGGGNRSRWILLENREIHAYLADMKSLRDLLAHGDDPRKSTNVSGMLWGLKGGGHSLRMMGVEGFIQAAEDLATQTVFTFGGGPSQLPSWPAVQRTTLSAETLPALIMGNC